MTRKIAAQSTKDMNIGLMKIVKVTCWKFTEKRARAGYMLNKNG
jgi:hypothetical protein